MGAQDCTLGRPRGMGWRGRQEGGSGWGTHVNPWLIHVKVWQKPVQGKKQQQQQQTNKQKKTIKKSGNSRYLGFYYRLQEPPEL